MYAAKKSHTYQHNISLLLYDFQASEIFKHLYPNVILPLIGDPAFDFFKESNA